MVENSTHAMLTDQMALIKSVKGLRLLAKTSPMMPTGKVWFKTKETKQLQCIISKRVTKENV